MEHVRQIIWIGTTRRRMREFPAEAKEQGGHELWQVQLGLMPTDWRAMPDVGKGVIEIRLHRPHEHRILYVSAHDEAVFVIHAFEKETQQTAKLDIRLARKNHAQIDKELQKIRQEQATN
jgi:phage-related protein